MPVEQTTSHHGLLGTVIETRLHATSSAAAADAETALIDEVRRLESVFNVFDRHSELSRWRTGKSEAGPELTEVLTLALRWQSMSRGAFNPEVGVLADLWSAGAENGEVPGPSLLSAAAERISSPGYVVDQDDRVRQVRLLESFDLNAIAKGWIVDQATSPVLAADDVIGVMVNAGGDLLNRGPASIVVGVEDPRRPYDNVPPRVRVRVDEGRALATSGGARRGWRIGDSWFSHVVDPRTGVPTDRIRSATVIAGDAVTADVLATTLTVLDPEEGLDLLGRIDGTECLLITSEDELIKSRSWGGLEVR